MTWGCRPRPTEGLGLNPNLENPWMVIHPPTLFLGFSSLAVPFAFALSALFWRDWDGWLRRALPWGLFGFAVLGLAMMMGGYWAYEMLGWGGFWEWDPVENGPFVPWMCLVAFLHAAQIQRVRGGFDKPTLFFAMLPFVGRDVRVVSDPLRRADELQRPLVLRARRHLPTTCCSGRCCWPSFCCPSALLLWRREGWMPKRRRKHPGTIRSPASSASRWRLCC